MVLFLFVIMLLNLGDIPRLPDFDWHRGAAFLAGVAARDVTAEPGLR